MSNATLQISARDTSARLNPSTTNAPSGTLRSDKIADEHLQRNAIVYVRQSKPDQP